MLPRHAMLPRGTIKRTPEDFVVEEIPLYEPSGEGEHLYLRFTKRNLTTDIAVRQIVSALGVNGRDVGVAGMKDKVAVTTQWISMLVPRGERGADIEARAMALAIDGVTIHEAKRHGNKLRTGHLEANRFSIAVRGIEDGRVDEVILSLERAGREGLPNAFGAQRFGRDKDNADRALAWLTGKAPAPRDPRQRRFLWSALQSAIFNEVLRRRVEDGTWSTPLEGDLVKRRASGGLFVCTDVQTDRARAEAGEIAPTGPIVGVKMRDPEGPVRELEQRVFREIVGESFDLDKTRILGEGTRRGLRLFIDGMRIEREDDEHREDGAVLRVYFVLPKGAYATTVLASALALDDTPDRPAASEIE